MFYKNCGVIEWEKSSTTACLANIFATRGARLLPQDRYDTVVPRKEMSTVIVAIRIPLFSGVLAFPLLYDGTALSQGMK